MITKSEDEWLMDEAISQQINQYLIKPISPNQVFIACKQILEKSKIIEHKTSSEYLQDFQKINEEINYISSLDEWWELYLRIVKWQLKFEEHTDSSLQNILLDQMKACNKQFSNYIENNYELLLKNENQSIFSPGVFKNYVQPSLNKQNKLGTYQDCL